MLSKYERFKDLRVSRFRGYEYVRRGKYRDERRIMARACAKEFKAAREDRRFALCELAAALDKHGITSFPAAFLAPIVAHDWPEHAAIPRRAWTLTRAHPSVSDPSKIACYPTRKDAERGREIVMSPGRFFAAAFPDWQPSEVQACAETYAQHAAPIKVHFAKDADDWCRVYSSARGFTSCMAGKWDCDDEENPIRFYAHPDNDLELAYLTHNGRANGETVARAIVNTEKLKYVRVYGDARLARALHDMGYSHDSFGALNKQKCNARENGNGDLIAPYLDGVGTVSWDGRRDWCRIDDCGDWDAQETDGTASNGNCAHCGDCGDRTHEDDMQYSEYEEVSVCSHCLAANFTLAIVGGSRRYPERDYVRDRNVINVGDESYVQDAADNFGLVLDADGEWQDADDCYFLEYLGEYVHADECIALDVPTDDGDDNARECDTIVIVLNGEKLRVHEDYNGPTDEKRAAAIAAARARVARKIRKFSRAPGRANRRNAIAARRARAIKKEIC
jgi:hypothetical protein